MRFTPYILIVRSGSVEAYIGGDDPAEVFNKSRPNGEMMLLRRVDRREVNTWTPYIVFGVEWVAAHQGMERDTPVYYQTRVRDGRIHSALDKLDSVPCDGIHVYEVEREGQNDQLIL